MSDENEAGTPNAEEIALSTEQDMRKVKQELEVAQKKAAENWDLFLRMRADSENIRRRALLDVENAHKYGIEKFSRELLSVVDSLDQGLSLAGSQDQGLREGLELTYKLLLSTLEKFGIKQLNPLGETFDPMKHEALSTQVNNEVQPNKILVVVQKGFILHDKLLRPARVIVSKIEERQPDTTLGS